MNVWIKSVMIALVILGIIWSIMGMCAAYAAWTRTAGKYGFGGPSIQEGLFLFIGCASSALIHWFLAVSLYLGAQSYTLFYANSVRKQGRGDAGQPPQTP